MVFLGVVENSHFVYNFRILFALLVSLNPSIYMFFARSLHFPAVAVVGHVLYRFSFTQTITVASKITKTLDALSLGRSLKLVAHGQTVSVLMFQGYPFSHLFPKYDLDLRRLLFWA